MYTIINSQGLKALQQMAQYVTHQMGLESVPDTTELAKWPTCRWQALTIDANQQINGLCHNLACSRHLQAVTPDICQHCPARDHNTSSSK